MKERHGTVWYGERRVGNLRDTGAQAFRFSYAPDWLTAGGFPISVGLPLSLGAEEVDAHTWFEGLLPEGRTRQRICRRLGISLEDDIGLLLAIGEDCAGALSILPAGAEPRAGHTPPRPLASADIDQLVRSFGTELEVLTGETQRFSLAGAQEKQPVIFNGAAYALPDRANPSTHILKFETVPLVCFSEFMSNDIARRLGLPVVACEFLWSGEGEQAVPYLRIRRYDRDGAGERPARVHQEDLLQALGEPTVLKYQKQGGPSIGRVAAVLREHTARPIEALALLRDWQIFNYLAGNWDGHAKNLALLYSFGESVPTLAPFYDLVAIEFLNLVRPHSWSRDMAIYIGEHGVPEQISRNDWETFAREIGMPPKRLLVRLGELAERLPAIAIAAREDFAKAQGDAPVYDRFHDSIERRCRWILNSVLARTA